MVKQWCEESEALLGPNCFQAGYRPVFDFGSGGSDGFVIFIPERLSKEVGA